MKKAIYLLFLPLVVIGGLVFANRQIKNEPTKKTNPKPITPAERESARKQWEATPEGIKYKKWETSPIGEQVLTGAAKINKKINASADVEAVITSLSLPPGSRLGFGVMARIEGVDYIVTFDTEKSQLEELRSLKVNDQLTIKPRVVSHAPKYAYPIVSVEDAKRDG